VEQIQFLGLFGDVDSASEALNALRDLNIPDEGITVLSGAPLKHQMLNRPHPKKRLGKLALLGALLGVALGLFLTVGIFLLYPLTQGGQPIVPVPPTLIVLFEATMLGTMWTTFFAMLGENRFPIFKRQIYDPRISEGYIGIAVNMDEGLADQVMSAFDKHGAADVIKGLPDEKRDPRHRLFWMLALGGLAVLIILIGLISYDVIKINFPTQMANQESVAYLEGPRLPAPAGAIPIQGPVLVDGQPAVSPVPSSAASIANGKALFTLVCAVCHGPAGNGKSPVAAFFVQHHPADLTSAPIQALTDAQIYLVITNGKGDMPPMAENLDPTERWDVINFVRTLAK